MSPIEITNHDDLVQELISLQSSLYTAPNGDILPGAEHSTHHLNNIIRFIIDESKCENCEHCLNIPEEEFDSSECSYFDGYLECSIIEYCRQFKKKDKV